jgi:hypothetical protein
MVMTGSGDAGQSDLNIGAGHAALNITPHPASFTVNRNILATVVNLSINSHNSNIPDPPGTPTAKQFPLLGTSRIGNSNLYQDDTLAVIDRQAIGSLDASLLMGLGGNTSTDQTPPPSGWIARTNATREILNANAANEHYLFTYFNAGETSDGGEQAAYLDAVVGPNGWDGWLRNVSGDRVSTWPNNYGVNCSNYVQADPVTGWRYMEWYADRRIQQDYIDVHEAAGIKIGGAGGINFNLDNFQLHINRSGCDWDNNIGGNDNAREYYDPEYAPHVAADPIAVIAYSGQRANLMKAANLIKDRYPNILFAPNTNTWQQRPSNNGEESDIGSLRNCILEYRFNGDPNTGDVHGGFSENNTFNDPLAWPRTAVAADGTTHARGPSAGSWIRSYCNIYQSIRLSREPKIVFYAGLIECLTSGTVGAGGQTLFSPVVHPTGSAWNLARWMAVTSWLCGAYFSPEGVVVGTESQGRARSTPIFDFFGLTNTSTTKLYRKWMGAAVDGVQTAARWGTLWGREFDNAFILLNPNNDDTDPPVTFTTSQLPGGASEWMNYQGFDDTTVCDGSYLGATEDIASIDARIWVRRSWYEAL